MKNPSAEKRKREVDRTPLTPGEKVVLERLRKKILSKKAALPAQ